MSPEVIAILTIALLFLLFLMGLEIGFSMALAGFVGFAVAVNPQAAFRLVANDIYSVFVSYGFTVIPLFVLMGQFGASSKVARSLYDCAYRFMGHVPGGLAVGTVTAATAFKAICGSSAATAATFASIAVPEMDRYGYDKRLSCGTVATVGTLGILIPPSVVLILYGLLTETSIGRLFLAGIIPGLIIALSFAVTIVGWCKLNPTLGPAGQKSSWKERLRSLPDVGWVLAIFVCVIGGLMKGIFTPTEAGSIGAFAVLILGIAKREMTWQGVVKALSESLGIACMAFTMLAGATILGHFFAVTRIPYAVADLLGNAELNRNVVMIIIFAVYLIGGSFIEDLAFLILATPIFLPLVVKLGYDPVWFGVIIAVVTMIGIILPPMAMNVFIVSGVTKVPIGTIYKGIYPYIVGMYICLFIFLFFPQISLWLPNLLMK
jgi:tripartite ATP-independent transporter DctM subunit